MHVIPRRYNGVDETLGVGAIAGDAIGSAARGIGAVGMSVGKLGVAVTVGTAGLVGRAAIGLGVPAVKYAGKAALGTADFLVRGGGPFKSPLLGAIKGVGKLGKSMVTYEGSHLQYNRYLGKLEKKGPSLKVSKFGGGVLAGLAGAQAVRGGFNAYMGSRMGTVDTKTTSITPDYSPQEYRIQHPDFAGATGDLVFALDANKHG